MLRIIIRIQIRIRIRIYRNIIIMQFLEIKIIVIKEI